MHQNTGFSFSFDTSFMLPRTCFFSSLEMEHGVQRLLLLLMIADEDSGRSDEEMVVDVLSVDCSTGSFDGDI